METTPFLTLVAITNALTQVVKMTDPEDKFARFYPLLALTIALGIGLGLMHIDALLSLTAGLTAVGVYSTVKKTINP